MTNYKLKNKTIEESGLLSLDDEIATLIFAGILKIFEDTGYPYKEARHIAKVAQKWFRKNGMDEEADLVKDLRKRAKEGYRVESKVKTKKDLFLD